MHLDHRDLVRQLVVLPVLYPLVVVGLDVDFQGGRFGHGVLVCVQILPENGRVGLVALLVVRVPDTLVGEVFGEPGVYGDIGCLKHGDEVVQGHLRVGVIRGLVLVVIDVEPFCHVVHQVVVAAQVRSKVFVADDAPGAAGAVGTDGDGAEIIQGAQVEKCPGAGRVVGRIQGDITDAARRSGSVGDGGRYGGCHAEVGAAVGNCPCAGVVVAGIYPDDVFLCYPGPCQERQERRHRGRLVIPDGELGAGLDVLRLEYLGAAAHHETGVGQRIHPHQPGHPGAAVGHCVFVAGLDAVAQGGLVYLREHHAADSHIAVGVGPRGFGDDADEGALQVSLHDAGPALHLDGAGIAGSREVQGIRPFELYAGSGDGGNHYGVLAAAREERHR